MAIGQPVVATSSIPTPVPTPESTITVTKWDRLVTHIKEYFYNPDIGALEIALSVAASHFHYDADPVWLFILGNSGGDKTSVIINCIMGLPETYSMGDLTPRTFLSGYSGNPNASLLVALGSKILTFKDFTTFASKKSEDQSEIGSQMREIYDGYFSKDTGKGIQVKWTGKMTVIAAATPALERHWGALSDLGERFVQVRIARKSGLAQAEYAQKQAGCEKFIRDHMKELAKDFFSSSPQVVFPPPLLSTAQQRKVSCLAELVAFSRGKVPRTLKGEISGIAEIENSSRVSKVLNYIASNHATLFRRSTVSDEHDMWTAIRVARNSMPVNRYLILSVLAKNGFASTTPELIEQTKLPMSSLKYHLGDLNALGMVYTTESDTVADEHEFTEDIRELWTEALG